jgi:imidazole glycerol-phosphate synthase subunit HisH
MAHAKEGRLRVSPTIAQIPVVGIVDYQTGNVRSIANAFGHLGARVELIRDSRAIDKASHLLLPGVGAFGFCVERLRASGLVEAIAEWTFTKKRPILGICVGMQLLADDSDELGHQSGLGWIGGTVRKLVSDDPNLRVPHVGWNTAVFEKPFGDFAQGESADFYFDHSYAYHAPAHGSTLAYSHHIEVFCSALCADNLIAAQFHPEKSQNAGMRFLRGFLAM